MDNRGLYGGLTLGTVYLLFAYVVTSLRGTPIYPGVTFANKESVVFVVLSTTIGLASFFVVKFVLERLNKFSKDSTSLNREKVD